MNVRFQVLSALAAGVLLLVPTAFVDSLFFPVVLAGPPIVGAVAAAVGLSRAPVVALWVSFGLTMLVVDWVVNQEDRIFHLVLTVVMTLLSLGGYAVVRALGASRATRTAVDPQR